uniref:Uncharacterized protein n=1 Tax=Ciona savignyi TaxID=51511 RepID=H2YHG0_CIOSA
MPEELKEDEERPEFPVVDTQYVVKYEMLADVTFATADTQECTTRGTARNASTMNASEPTPIALHFTDPQPWEDGKINFNFRHLHVVYDLESFRDFLLQGISFTIQAKTTMSWPSTPVGGEETPTPDTPALKSRGADTPSKKGKDAKGKDKGGKGEKDKGKKKASGRETEMEMRSDPPTFTDIGTYHIPLSHFLEGDRNVTKVCHCGGGPMPSKEELERLKAKEMEEIKPETKGTKRGTPSADKSKKGKPGSAGKKKDAKKDAPNEEAATEDEPVTPPPIILEVGVNLLRWDTAADCLKV